MGGPRDVKGSGGRRSLREKSLLNFTRHTKLFLGLMQFVFGSQVDYVDGLQGAGFVVNNPNVVAACGCGSSFQVREDAAESAAASV